MNVSREETQAFLVLCSFVITVGPTLAIAVKAYLNTKINTLRLINTPTHMEVDTKIQEAVQQALTDNHHE